MIFLLISNLKLFIRNSFCNSILEHISIKINRQHIIDDISCIDFNKAISFLTYNVSNLKS